MNFNLQVYELGGFVQDEFKKMLNENLWMDEFTKKAALKKVSFI